MNPKLAIALIALALPLAGCGNKGPLVLASPPAPLAAPATPEGAVPVEIAPPPVVVDPSAVVPADPPAGTPPETDD